MSLDGTTIKANAFKHRALGWGHADEAEQQLRAEVDELMRLAEKADVELISDGMNIPEEISRREERLNVIALTKEKIEQRATRSGTHDQPLIERFALPAPLPDDAAPIDQMRHKLKTDKRRQVYAQRKCTVEPVFGIVKHVLGFRQYFFRGIEAVAGECTLVSIDLNG